MSFQFVFNQYYIDLLKRLKSECKKIKETGDEDMVILSKKVSKSIKDNYMTIDKSSDVYIKYIKDINTNLWTSYLQKENNVELNELFLKDDIASIEIFTNITIGDIFKILNDNYLFNHFITVFYIFKDENTDEQITNIVKYLQSITDNVSIDTIESDDYKKLLLRLKTIRYDQVKDKTGVDLSGIQNTSIGRLAKEILEDVDVEKIQKSIGENGDVLKAIGDPDSGFTELIASVSRKMATKISNGELKQENLMQDALQFASIIPGMFGKKTDQGSQGNAPDMSGMMDMMSKMMGNKDNMDMMSKMMGNKDNMDMMSKMMGGQTKQPKNTMHAVNNSVIKKNAYAKKLRTKLHERNEKREN